jgi:hypothetical protein
MDLNTRTAFIDGLNPNDIEGFEIDQIRPDELPSRIVNAVRLAQADGQKFINAGFIDKKIYTKGHFYAGTRVAYEIARDKLLGMFDPDALISMEFEQSGEMRRYYGTYENVIFDYKDNGTCIVNITYTSTDPFGYTIAETTFYQATGITDEITETIDSDGNVHTPTKIVCRVNDIDSDENERTFSFTMSQGVRSYNIQVTRVWSENDTLTIDSVKQRVYVNGIQVEYTGRFPQVYKTNTFRFNIPDAATFDVDITVTYNKRWL